MKCIAPRKNETVLDPACGTAGFLISAYKYIDKQNRDEEGKSTLSGEDRKRMADNVAGYDISPDMVRLSRVNMYLHGFSNPQISEYDTLTSLDKWDDTYDVILANPPFMTHKGGISPHNRYRVSAKRAEVLFVDYIAEHLSPTGRAAIVVPEGIVLQSQTAYRSLRQYLIDDDLLYAVISLPAGVFNPYSGVKTSILLIDKTLAKEQDSILFVKLNNDGYDLGAQRRQIQGSEIPDVIRCIKEFQAGAAIVSSDNVVIAKKSIIRETEYTLIGERYKEKETHTNKYPLVSLGNKELFRIESGGTPDTKKPEYWNGEIAWTTLTDLPAKDFVTFLADTERHITEAGLSSSSAKVLPPETILVSSRATIGRIALTQQPTSTNQGFKNIVVIDKNRVSPKYIAYVATSLVPHMVELASGGIFKEISKKNFSTLQIPLPPISIQHELTKEIDEYLRIIDGARQVVGNYRPFIKVNPTWEDIAVGDIYDISYGITISIPQNEDENGVKIISTAEVGLDGSLDLSNIRKVKFEDKYAKFVLEPNTLLFNWRNAPKHVGKTALFLKNDDQYISASFLLSLKNKDPKHIDNRFIWCALNNLRETGYFMRNARQAVNQANFNGDQLSKTVLKVPDIETQRMIMAKIEEEMTIVEQNKRLIEIYEQKIKDRIAEVWGE